MNIKAIEVVIVTESAIIKKNYIPESLAERNLTWTCPFHGTGACPSLHLYSITGAAPIG